MIPSFPHFPRIPLLHEHLHPKHCRFHLRKKVTKALSSECCEVHLGRSTLQNSSEWLKKRIDLLHDGCVQRFEFGIPLGTKNTRAKVWIAVKRINEELHISEILRDVIQSCLRATTAKIHPNLPWRVSLVLVQRIDEIPFTLGSRYYVEADNGFVGHANHDPHTCSLPMPNLTKPLLATSRGWRVIVSISLHEIIWKGPRSSNGLAIRAKKIALPSGRRIWPSLTAFMIRLGRHENKLRLLPVAIFPDLLRSFHWKAMHSIQYWNVIPWKLILLKRKWKKIMLLKPKAIWHGSNGVLR